MIRKIIFTLSIAAIAAGCSHTPALAPTESLPPESSPTARMPVPKQNPQEPVAGPAAIRLTSPQEDQILKSPFIVGGEAKVPSDTVMVRVKNPGGTVLIEEEVAVKPSSGEFGAFGILLSFVFQSTDAGVVEVYGTDELGNPVGLVSVPVTFDVSTHAEAGQ